jgi:hypothetical protein
MDKRDNITVQEENTMVLKIRKVDATAKCTMEITINLKINTRVN